jgi:hypothetical protein
MVLTKMKIIQISVTFASIQVEKPYPAFFTQGEGQITRNNNFGICFTRVWLLPCFGSITSVSLQESGGEDLKKFGLEKAEANMQVGISQRHLVVRTCHLV